MTDQCLVFRQCFGSSVLQVRQQREVKVLILICQVADFQLFNQRIDALDARQHRRNSHERTHLRGKPFGKVHSRQRARADELCHQEVHQPDGQLTRGAGEQEPETHEHPLVRASACNVREQKRRQDRRQCRDWTEV